ncbi:unnamed protein product [Effrenium voratum]|uniref:Uncharacterized protein n=1 Tax=Effrenium voratum TaxID=2562239 RepID=A0AA36NKY5_9DINO|nr:unnamed protein product [Effrenium voratum]
MLVHSWTCPDVGPRRVSRTLPPQNSSQYNGHLLYKARLRSSRKTWGPSLPKAEVARAQGVPSEHTMLLRRLKIYRFEFIMNPFTGLLTDQRVCPVQESPELGFECFEGPFDQIGVTDVLTQCQDGRFEWNFCKNRKSIDGRPFTACCSFLYLNSRGTAECQFMGTAQGSCETLLQELERNRSISAYTRIGNQQILKTCSMDSCNNPDDVVAGCPAVVNKEPAITEGLRSTLQPSREDMLQGSQDRPPEPPPWGLIGGLSAVPFVLVCVAMVLSKLGVFKEAIDPLFHSSKAIVVASDTFIEPQRDLIVSGTGVDTKPLAYGRVEPRAVGLKKIQEEEKVLPLALRQKAADAVPEAANAAWVDAVVTEAMVQRETPLLHGTHVLAGTTYTGEGVICLPEELDMPYMERQALALNHPSALSDRTKSYDELTITTQHQAVSVSGAPLSSRMHTSRTSKSGVRTASKLTQRTTLTSEYSTDLVAITERTLSQGGTLEEQILHQEALPEPPTELAAPEMGHVEGSISGLVLSPVSVGQLANGSEEVGRPKGTCTALLRQPSVFASSLTEEHREWPRKQLQPGSPTCEAHFSAGQLMSKANATQQSLRLLAYSLAGISAFFILLHLLLTYVLGGPGMITVALVLAVSAIWVFQRSQFRALGQQEELLMQHRAFAAEVERAWERSHAHDERRKGREAPAQAHAPSADGSTAKKRKKKKAREDDEETFIVDDELEAEVVEDLEDFLEHSRLRQALKKTADELRESQRRKEEKTSPAPPAQVQLPKATAKAGALDAGAERKAEAKAAAKAKGQVHSAQDRRKGPYGVEAKLPSGGKGHKREAVEEKRTGAGRGANGARKDQWHSKGSQGWWPQARQEEWNGHWGNGDWWTADSSWTGAPW